LPPRGSEGGGASTEVEEGETNFYRVNFEVQPLKPFSSLAFPIFPRVEIPLKQPSFGDELVTSSLWVSNEPNPRVTGAFSTLSTIGEPRRQALADRATASGLRYPEHMMNLVNA
jgi:hypothetical protein